MSISLSLLYFSYIIEEENKAIEKRLFHLLFAILFSNLILKINLFRHQKVSILISIIGFIFFNIPNINNNLFEYILYMIIPLFYTLYIIGLKYLNINYFLSPFLCSFLCGIISLILSQIGLCVYSLYKYEDLSYIIKCFNFSGNEIEIKYYIFFIMTIIFCILYKGLNLSIISHFSPILFFISEIISPIIFLICEFSGISFIYRVLYII